MVALATNRTVLLSLSAATVCAIILLWMSIDLSFHRIEPTQFQANLWPTEARRRRRRRGRHRRKRTLDPTVEYAKRQYGIAPMKVPAPVFVLSLPKSGTTTASRYFACGNGLGTSAHTLFKNKEGLSFRIGKLMYDNHRQNRSILEGFNSDHLVLSDIGAFWMEEGTWKCYFPSIHGLEHIYASYPNATIVLIHRDPQDWVKSIRNFNKRKIKGRGLLERISTACGFLGVNRHTFDLVRDKEWVDFYNNHTHTIRQFAESHPSLTYIEASLEAPDTPSFMQNKTGIPAQACWFNCKPNEGSLCRTIQ